MTITKYNFNDLLQWNVFANNNATVTINDGLILDTKNDNGSGCGITLKEKVKMITLLKLSFKIKFGQIYFQMGEEQGFEISFYGDGLTRNSRYNNFVSIGENVFKIVFGTLNLGGFSDVDDMKRISRISLFYKGAIIKSKILDSNYYLMSDQIYNIDIIIKNKTLTVINGDKELFKSDLTDEENNFLKQENNFDIMRSNYAGYLNQDYVTKIQEFILDTGDIVKYLFQDKTNDLYTLNPNLTNLNTQSPTEELFKNQGFDDITLLNSLEHKQDYKLLVWTDNVDAKSATLNYSCETFRPIDKLDNKFKVLMYKE